MKTFIFDLFGAAMFAGLLQNIVFTGGFGITEAIIAAAKPKNLAESTGFTAFFSLSLTLIATSVQKIPAVGNAGMKGYALITCIILALIYSAALLIARLLHFTPVALRRMGVCALNSLVLSLPLMSYKSAFSTAAAIGTAVGGVAAYALAVLLLRVGMEKINTNPSVPDVFKGNGAVFIYTAILSLAFAGITGSRICL